MGKYYFDLVKCRYCRNIVRVLSNHQSQVILEQKIHPYRCDAVLRGATLQDCKIEYRSLVLHESYRNVVMEVFHTHATVNSKIKYLRQSNFSFAEFKAQDVIDCLENYNGQLVELHVLHPETICDTCTMQQAHDLHSVRRMDAWWQKLHSSKAGALFDELQDQQRTILEAHDLTLVAKIETWWHDLYMLHATVLLEKLQTQRRKKRQRQAFYLAQQQEEYNQSVPRKRTKYVHGEMFKCGECGSWERIDDSMVAFFADNSAVREDWFDEFGSYFWVQAGDQEWSRKRKAVVLCDRCVIKCYNCGSEIPLQCSLRYGFCWSCNLCQI